MTNKDIQKQFQFFVESDWNSQRIIYLDTLEQLAAERDRADRAETRIGHAPHAEDCDLVLYPELGLYPSGDSSCDCWKSEANA